MKKNFTQFISEVSKARQFTFATVTLLLFLISAAYLMAAVGITVTGSATFPITADFAANSTTPGFTSIGTVVITETDKTEISSSGNIIIKAPSGWRFKSSGISPVVSLAPGETGSVSISLGNAVVSSDGSQITIPLTVSNTNKLERITIDGIEVQALNGAIIPGTGSVTIGVANGAVINGLSTSVNTSIASVSQKIGAAKKLAFVTQPINVVSGANLTPAPQVAIQDQFGNTITGASNAVALTIGNNPGSGTLTAGTSTTTNGVVTFTGYSIDAAGTGYTLTATSGGLTSVTSNAFNVNSKVPTLAALPATCVTQGATDLTLTVTGTNFERSSVVRVDGVSRPTTYISSTQLQVVIPATDLAIAGNRIITVLNPAPPANNTSNSQTLVVNPAMSAATIVGEREVCAGKEVLYEAPAGFTNYNWTVTQGAGVLEPTNNPAMVRFEPTVPASGKVTISVTATNACNSTSTASFDVTVLPTPIAVIAYDSPTICEGTSQVLSVASAPAGDTYTYQWFRGTTVGGATTPVGTNSPTLTVNTAGVYTVTITGSNNCPKTSDPVEITVDPLPVATITTNGPTTFCEGGQVTLTAEGGDTYLWSNGSTNKSITVDASGTFTVQVTDGNSCTSAPSASVTVTENPLPVATITAGGATTFCQGGLVTLTASAGESWLWSNGATTQSITVSTTESLSVIVTDANGCTSAASAPVAVTVNPIPAAPVVMGDAVCDQGAVTLGATVGANGSAVRWYTASSGGTPVATGATYTTPNLTTTTTYYASSFNETTGCESARVAVVATVNPLPTVSITPTGPLQFCEGNSVVLVPTALPTGDTFTYAWFNAADDSEVGTTKDYVATTSGDYYLVVTNQNGCQQTSETLTVVVAEIPTEANITLTGASTFCQGGSVKLSANKSPDADNPYMYKWFKNDIEIASATSETYTANESGDYQVEVTNLIEDCSKMSAKIKITVLPQPVAIITSTNEQKCIGAGNTTTFSVTGDYSGGTAQWLSSNNSFIISNPVYNAATGKATATVTATGTGSSVITLRTTNNAASCTTASSTVTLTVNPLPTAGITAGGPTTFCQGGTVVLSAPQGDYSYQWFRGGNAITVDGTARTYTASTAGNYTVRVTDNSTQCVFTTATATTVTVNPQPTVTAASASPAAKCVGAGNVTVFDLTGAAANGTLLWSVVGTTGGASVSNISSPKTTATQVTVSGVGTVTIRLSSSSTVASCTTASRDVTLTVYPMPTANAGVDQTLCQATSGVTFFTRQGSGSASEAGLQVNWTVKSKDAGVNVSIGYPWMYSERVDITGVGNVTLTMTVTENGCSTSDEVTYTVKPRPVITTVNNKTYCNGAAGEAINLESSVAGSIITWTATNNVGFGTSGTGNIPAYTATNTGTSTLSTTVTVNASINGCSATQKSFIVTVYPTPKLTNIPASVAICSGATFNYTPAVSPNTSTTTWTRAAVEGISNAATNGTGAINETLVNTTTTNKVVTYVYTVAANGCTNTQNVSVTVKPKPQPTFTGVTEGQVFASGDGTITLVGQPAGGTFSGPGVTGTTFSPCNAINNTPSGIIPITYTVTVDGCTNSITKTVNVKRSAYTVVVTAVPMPFCRGDNVTYTTKVLKDVTSIVYPYLVDNLGRPVYENGTLVPAGSGNLPVPNPAYPFPAGTPDIIKAMAYRFFEPIVTGGTPVDPNSFTYQWHKNEAVERKNDGVITTDAGLSSMDYYGVYVTSKNSNSCVPTLTSQLSDRKYSAEIEEYTSTLTATPICQVGTINFTATLSSAFPYWSDANLQVELVRERGTLVLATATYSGSNTFNFAVNTANVDLVNGDKVYVRFNSILDQYRAQSKCAGRPNSNLVTIQIDQPVAITANLAPTPAQCEAGSVTLSVAATGSNLQYAWYKEGSATPLTDVTGKISGATTNAVTISNLALSDAGKYYVTVSNSSSSVCSTTVTSNTTEFIVNPLTRITAQPQGLTLCSGSAAAFSASATGTNLTYQWYKGTTSIPGATSTTLNIASVTAADAGDYTVRVTGTCGVLTSSVATLIVNEPVTAAPNLAATTQCQGSTVNMSVTATGAGLIYEWFKNNESIGNNSNTLSIPNAQEANNGTYSVKVTGTCTPNGVIVDMGTLKIEPNVVANGEIFATHKTDGRPITTADPVKIGETAVFTVDNDFADNDEVVEYLWYVRPAGSDESAWTIVQRSSNNVYERVAQNDDPYEVKVNISILGTTAKECYFANTIVALYQGTITPLPVELIYFKAVRRDNTAVLTWATASEKNNEGFEVQVSQDGVNYRQLQFVASKNGNTTIKQTYEFVDKENGKFGTRYYRLRQLDSDGQYAYYGPQMVIFGDVSNSVFVYPNPFEREVKLDVDSEKDAVMEVTLTNLMGRKLLTRSIEVAKGRSSAALDLGEGLPAGIYIVTTRLNGITTNFKLMKK